MSRQSPPTRSLASGPGTVLKPKLPRGLYAIADSQFGNPLLLGQALLNAGALTLQIRTKTWSTAERIQLGRALLPLATDLGALLIMNDDINAACELGIGLHLGQEDGRVEAARSRLGHRAIIGRSTHSLDQIRDLEPEIDYIGFGPMFTTQTKETGWSPRGIPPATTSHRLQFSSCCGYRRHHLGPPSRTPSQWGPRLGRDLRSLHPTRGSRRGRHLSVSPFRDSSR